MGWGLKRPCETTTTKKDGDRGEKSGESHGEEESDRWEGKGREDRESGIALAHRCLQQEEMLSTFSGSVRMGVIFSSEGLIKRGT